MFVRGEKLPPLVQLMSCEERRLGKITEVIPWRRWLCSSNAGRMPSLQKQLALSQNAAEIKFQEKNLAKNTPKMKERESLDSHSNLPA